MEKNLIKETEHRRLIWYAFSISLTLLMVMCFTARPAIAVTPGLTDISISDRVEHELRWDEAVPSQKIDITTTDGVVTLKGWVDNILAKDRAARIARIVKGVRSVVNLIEVEPAIHRTDAQIKDDVEKALLADPATDSFKVKAVVNNNLVTLSGQVDSYQEKVLCKKVTEGVRGVRGVNNNVKINLSKTRSENEIKTDVERVLDWDPFIDNGLITVTVKDDKVILSGIVGSAAEQIRAGDDAWVMGARYVDFTQLEVQKWSRDKDLRKLKYNDKSAKEIEEAVKYALLSDPRVYFFNVTPEVDKNHPTTVILRGKVNNLKAKRAAGQDARNTVGVWQVENYIKVRTAKTMNDEQIKKQIEQAFFRDPYLESYEINVKVMNGEANLYGTVNSFFEKFQADDLASKTKGVIMVDNHLLVRENNKPYVYESYVDDWDLYAYNWYQNHATLYPRTNDRQIERDIKEELLLSPFVNALEVNVEVEKGMAKLTGKVDSWLEYTAAQSDAYKGGAVYVDNELTIK